MSLPLSGARMMRILQRARFALRHPVATAVYLLRGNREPLRVARVMDRAAHERMISGRPSVLEELEAYLGLPRSEVALNLARGHELVAARWRRENPQTPEQIYEFHRHCSEYVYDLARWHMTPTYHGYLALLNDERDGTVLSFGGGIGTEALQLAAQGNEVWYCDIADSPVWKVAEWRARRRNIPIRFISDIPRGEQFDCVVAFDVFGSLAATELEALLPRLVAVLKSGGRLYCTNNFNNTPTSPFILPHERLWDRLVARLPLVQTEWYVYVKREAVTEGKSEGGAGKAPVRH